MRKIAYILSFVMLPLVAMAGDKNYLKSESDALVWLWSDWTEKLYKYIQRRKPYWMYWLNHIQA